MDEPLSDINAMAGHFVGRGVDLRGVDDYRETKALDSTMDFRDIRYRREVFLRFYVFHLKLRAHPGCVYYLMPELASEYRWDLEQKLWYAFINGCTQHPVTSLVIFREFPEVPGTTNQLRWFTEWFNTEWSRLPFDTDRRYQKKEFPKAVERYSAWAGSRSQGNAWGKLCVDRDPQVNFDACWKEVQSDEFWGFGRLSTWSYLEYLRIMGLPLEPSSMMLKDMDGSKSHRNGLAKVLGRDDLDWVKGGDFQGKYSREVLAWLETEADQLLIETRARIHHQDISRFTLESALCTFKGWFRKDRRYPNVYNDMLRDRIRHVEGLRPDEDFSVFWKIRDRAHQAFPWALVERDPTDPGLAKPKQNHFRETGKVPMMNHMWPVFRHDETWRLPA